MNLLSNKTTLIASDKTRTGFAVVDTGCLDCQVFVSDSNGKIIDWQPLDSHHFGDGDNDDEVHFSLVSKWSQV